MIKLGVGRVIIFLILINTINSINQWSKFPIGNTFFWWGINVCLLIAFLKAKKNYYDHDDDRNIKVLAWYLVWNIICIIRGFFVAENYWEWKDLIGTAMVLLLPLSVTVFTNPVIIAQTVRLWLNYALPAFFLFLPSFAYPDAMGRYLIPISFLLLVFPLLPRNWKIISLLFTFLVVFGALDARSSVIKYSVSLLLGLVYLFRNTVLIRLLNVLRWVLLVMPIMLFFLAFTNIFNIFKMDEYIKGDYTTTVIEDGQARETNLTVDTRTFLYEEVLASAKKYDYIWLGRTPARGNESASFGDYALEVLKTGKMERSYNEVAILNTFTWTGVIGVVLYFLVFYQASYLAVCQSNNTIMRIMGIFVAFRWTYGWVEDFSAFDLSYIYLWMIIGMCFASAFRKMDDLEMEIWVKGIFDKRLREVAEAD